MVAKGGSLGELYFSITGEDRLEEILRKDKKLAEEVARITGGIQIGRTKVSQERAREIIAEAKAAEAQAKAEAIRNESLAKTAILEQRLQTETEKTNVARSRAEASARKLSATEVTAAGSIKMLEAELKKLKDTYRSLSETDRNSILGQAMLTQINEADQSLAKINAKMANNAALAKTMGTQYNGLRTQIGMVARELPNLGISIGTFIISLSNNLAYLADEIAKANKEFASLKDSGKAATPVWKQMIGAILSWQTALIVGITILTAYSREIQAWVQELISGEKNVNKLKESLSNFNEELIKGETNARLLFESLTRTNEGTEGRRKVINQINNEYGKYLPNLLTEKSSINELDAAYKQITKSIKDSLAARIQSNAINEVAGESIKKQAEALAEIRHIAEKKVRGKDENYFVSMVDDIVDLTETFRNEGYDIEKTVRGVFDKIRYLTNNADLGRFFAEELRQYVENYYNYQDELIQIQKKYNPFFDKQEANKAVVKNKAYWEEIKVQAESALHSISSEELKLLKQGITTGIDPNIIKLYNESSKALKEANEQLKVHENKEVKAPYIDTEKQIIELDKASSTLKEAITKAELEIEQARINTMEEGATKTLAQIRLNYRKRNEAIEKESRESLEKVRKVEREQWEKDNPNFKKDKLQFTSIIDLRNQLENVGEQMNEIFGKGNVDLLTRPIIDAAQLAKKGWEEAGEGIATVFSSSFQISQGDEDVRVHVTPILPDGTVLSPEELEEYIDNTLNGAENILQADKKGLGIVLNVDTNLNEKVAEDFGEGLHKAQEKYFDLLEMINKNPLNESIKNIFDNTAKLTSLSNQQLERDTVNLTNKLTTKWTQYADKRQAIEIDFNNKVKEIEEDRASIGNELANKALEKAQKERRDALSELESELFSLTDVYRKIFGDISDMTVPALKRLVDQSEKIIESAKGKFNEKGELVGYTVSYDGKDFNLATEQLDRFRKKIVELKQDINQNDPFGALSNYASQFIQSLKDVEKAQKEVDLAKNGQGSVVGSHYDKETNKIVLNLKSQKQAEEELNDAISKRDTSLKGVGMAANALGQIVKDLTADWANMFSAFGDDTTSDTLNAIGEITGQVGELAQNLASGNPIQQAVGVLGFVPGIIGSIARLHDKKLDRAIERSQLQVKKLQSSYENLERVIDRQLGSATEKQARQQVQNLQQQRAEVQKQMDAENAKKDKDKEALVDYQSQLAELDEQIKYFYEDLANEQFGIDMKGWADEIASALTDAFAKGEDAAAAFDDTVASIMKSVINNMISLNVLQPAMEKLRNYLFGENGKGGVLSDGELSESDAAGLVKELEGLKGSIANGKKIWDFVNEAAKEVGIDLEENNKNTLSQGIKGVTEDTASAIGGYINAMRADLSVNRVNLQTLVDNAIPFFNEFALRVADLKHLETIANNTGRNVELVGEIRDILDGARRDKNKGLHIL